MDTLSVFGVGIVSICGLAWVFGPKGSRRYTPRDTPLYNLQELRELRADLDSDLTRLKKLRVFGGRGKALVDAWEDRHTGKIERLLKDGEQQTESASDEATFIYNSAVHAVDALKDGLSHLLKASEEALARFNIDYSTIEVSTSKHLRIAFEPVSIERDFTQRLELSRGTGFAVARAASGVASWQAAAVTVAIAGVTHLINESRLMRQLSEMQGHVMLNAKAARRDFALIHNAIKMRIIPQFDGLMALYEKLDSGLTHLPAVAADELISEEVQRQAFDLACLLREGQMYLTMMAGD